MLYPCRCLPACAATQFRGGALTAVFCLSGIVASAQPSLLLSSESTKLGGPPVSLSLTYSSGGVSAGISAVQWTLTYSPADIASVTISAGPAGTAAAKSLLCSGGSGTYTCIVFGAANQTAISDGTLAQLQVTLAATAGSSVPVQITNPVASDGGGVSVPISATAGIISIASSSVPPPVIPPIATPTLTGVTCAPWFLIEPQAATCTVSLSAAAPAGLNLLAASSASELTVAPQIPIPTGATTVAVAVTAGPGSSSTSPTTVTLTLGGSTIAATLNVLPPLATTSFTLVNADTAECLTADELGIRISAAAIAVQQPCIAAASQTVQLSAASNGYTLGFNANTLFLNTQSSTGAHTTPSVFLSAQAAGLSSIWDLVPATTGTFLVMSAENQRCLSVQTNALNKRSVQEKTCSTAASERWSLVPVTAQ